MNEDLKWLAENVHEWEDGCCAIQKDDCGSYDFLHGSRLEEYTGVGEICFTRAQWKAARDELSGKPGWNDAPEDATHLIQNPRGQWAFLVDFNGFKESGAKYYDAMKIYPSFTHGKVLGDWRNTLERRPMSVNQALEKMREIGGFDVEKSLAYTNCESPAEWRGPEDGLPPAGAVLEAWFDDGRRCWHKAHVVGYHPSEANTIAVSLIGDHESRLIWSYMSGIRPDCSEEDRAVEEMVAATDEHLTPEDTCRALYRAGYRKQESK